MSSVTEPATPRRVIVVLLDSLNRHLLGAYASTPGASPGEFATPNLDRLAARSVRFDRHYTGSLPCMPARHDLLCGALDFLWKPWGSIELWEDAITVPLRAAGVVTKLVTDHPHLFEVGGENYHADFTAWDYQRGHESDPWQTRPDPSWLGAPTFGRPRMPYDDSRGRFRAEADFPGPKTMAAAAAWLETDAPHHEQFMLFVDEFDPHEPFDTPEPYASMYDAGWEGPHLIWPPYMRGAVDKGVLKPDEARQIRAQYGAKLTMIDAWFGRLLDAIDAADLWDTTAVIVTTDHGHYLGEKDVWGKPQVPIYEQMGRIPLFVSWPGVAPGSCDALTTSVDINATLRDVFGIDARQRTHGRSLVPLITGQQRSVREWAVAGVWGREVHLVADDGTKYARAPVGDNAPLSMWSNRWSTMPTLRPGLELPVPDERARLDRMPGTTIPVIRQPFDVSDNVPFWALGRFSGNHLFSVDDDPTEDHNRAGTPAEKAAADALGDVLRELEAPDDQLVRLGLA